MKGLEPDCPQPDSGSVGPEVAVLKACRGLVPEKTDRFQCTDKIEITD